MKTLTVDQIIALHPCYSDCKVRDLLKDKENWSALDILSLDIPPEDKLWAVLREKLIDPPILHEFACQCAEQELNSIPNPDPRSVAAIAAKRAWVRGEITDEALREARVAAREAASETDWWAAWWAASGTARVAAGETARETARVAAWATSVAVKTKQVEFLMEMLNKHDLDEGEEK